MAKTIPITQFGFKVLTEKQKELHSVVKRTKKRSSAHSSAYQRQLSELDNLLERSQVIEFDEKSPASVQIGTKVIIENLKTGDRREYTVMSSATANPVKGIISSESPIAEKMMGLKLGNTFKTKDRITGQEESYKIISIE